VNDLLPSLPPSPQNQTYNYNIVEGGEYVSGSPYIMFPSRRILSAEGFQVHLLVDESAFLMCQSARAPSTNYTCRLEGVPHAA